MNRKLLYVLPPVAVLVLYFLVSRTTDEDVLARAHRELRAGRIDTAAVLARELQPGEGEAGLRRAITDALLHRREVRAALDDLGRRMESEDRKVIFAALDKLAAGEKDPVLDEEISRAKNEIYDAYASGSRRWHRSPSERGSTEPPGYLDEPEDDLDEEPTPTVARATEPATDESDDPGDATPGRGWNPVTGTEPEGTPSAPARASDLDWNQSAEELAKIAFMKLDEGDLAAAHEAFVAAARRTMDATWGKSLTATASEVESRLVLRREVVAAFRDDPRVFEDLPCDRVDEVAGVRIAGRNVAWSEVTIAQWAHLRRGGYLSDRAELGFVLELLQRDEVDEAWNSLRRLLRDERVDQGEAFALIARQRREPVPEHGYTFDGKDWLAADVAQAIARDEMAAKMKEEFAKAKGSDRDRLFDEFVRQGLLTELRAVMQDRWNTLGERYDRITGTKRLGELAERRENLDQARRAALELIFDQEEYFYPWRPPACPADRAAEYPEVQRRVADLVGDVRRAWATDFEVKLKGPLREVIEEVQWLDRRGPESGLQAERPEDLPVWLLGIDLNLETIGVTEFAWNPIERKDLAYNRAVRARNVHLWEVAKVPENGRAAGAEERRQVEVTNDYRVMMGRKALAWNPLIQGAAWDHSTYMANTGEFGHDEPDPERKGPRQRMMRRGYRSGVGENCHMGSGGAEGAHSGWFGSSGHHRNLLSPGHREMASAVVNRYWTQNFGVGDSFVQELSQWSD